MKIIVSHVYSDDNKGDAALLSVLISDLQNTFKKCEITVLTIDRISSNEKFEGSTVKNAYMYSALNRYGNPVFKLLHSFFVITITLLWALVFRFFKINIWLPNYLKDVTYLYKDADLIVLVGGGFMRGKPDIVTTIGVLLMLHPLILGKILDKPIVTYPQSIGPFGNIFQKFFVKNVFKYLDLIIVREDVSYNLLRQLGITKNVIRSIDSGFLFTSNIKLSFKRKLNIPSNKIVVGITVRSWLGKDGQYKYEKAVAALADHIINHYGYAIVFIPQVTATYHKDDDREVSKSVYKLMRQKNNVYVMNGRYDHHSIKSMYSEMDYIIGTRFHSVIFSLTSYVPAIAIEYEHKTSGIMQDLDLQDWVVKIEDVTSPQLIILFDKLVKQNKKYKIYLRSILPEYLLQGKEVPRLIKNIYNEHVSRS